jgi:carbon starvation protein
VREPRETTRQLLGMRRLRVAMQVLPAPEEHGEAEQHADARGELLAPATSMADMQRVIANDWINATLAVAFLAIMLALAALGVRAGLRWRRSPGPSSESPYVALAEAAR